MTPALALVEPRADRTDGHYTRTLLALAQADGDALAVLPPLTPTALAEQLGTAGAHVAVRPHGTAAAVLHAAARHTADAATAVGALFHSRRWPRRMRRLTHQLALLATALREAAAVRTAHRLRPGTAVVVLTAAPGLHALVGLLGGRHLRFVHEITTTEDLPLRLIGHLARPGRARVLVLAPTSPVKDDITARFPGLPVQVRPYAVADPTDRVSATERAKARADRGLTGRHTAVALVGGWWPEKDLLTVDRALAQLTRPVDLLVTGYPLDHQRIDQWHALPGVRVHLIPGPASDREVRELYAAADAVLVSRHRGVGKESGLVADAIRFGLPLLCSEHRPDLTRQLTGKPWARTYPVGDPAQLAALLDQLADQPLPPPGPDAAVLLGIPTAADQVAFLTNRQPGEPR
ncbi:glycosyltransferase family protein [Streptacidiphilus rugosus]|uniref:glycosyltransferase family 1 protein n=1 Tax=Streptacidiphilus rugosus TaxID=405783 RepID=UPI000565B953|nr:glycosyltransferase family 1 protein [Streptacidiphilus rugosus]